MPAAVDVRAEPEKTDFVVVGAGLSRRRPRRGKDPAHRKRCKPQGPTSAAVGSAEAWETFSNKDHGGLTRSSARPSSCHEGPGERQFDRFVAGMSTSAASTITIRRLTALDPTYTAEAARVICDGVPGMDEAASYPVQLCLNELQNVFEWSESRIGCVVLTRWFHRSRSVRLAVVDRGIGIPARLRDLRIADLHRETDANVIAAAVTRPQLTSRVGRAGGLGLKTIHEVVTSRRGRLTVMSHNAGLLWVGSKSPHSIRSR